MPSKWLLKAAVRLAPQLRKTTLLVVGDQDIDRLAGKDKSLKHIKAESLIAQGQKIRILGESDFQALLRPI